MKQIPMPDCDPNINPGCGNPYDKGKTKEKYECFAPNPNNPKKLPVKPGDNCNSWDPAIKKVKYYFKEHDPYVNPIDKGGHCIVNPACPGESQIQVCPLTYPYDQTTIVELVCVDGKYEESGNFWAKHRVRRCEPNGVKHCDNFDPVLGCDVGIDLPKEKCGDYVINPPWDWEGDPIVVPEPGQPGNPYYKDPNGDVCPGGQPPPMGEPDPSNPSPQGPGFSPGYDDEAEIMLELSQGMFPNENSLLEDPDGGKIKLEDFVSGRARYPASSEPALGFDAGVQMYKNAYSALTGNDVNGNSVLLQPGGGDGGGPGFDPCYCIVAPPPGYEPDPTCEGRY